MASINTKGSSGRMVEIDIRGVNEVRLAMERKVKKIIMGAELGIIKAGAFIEEEVQESIAGHRAEPKSVDTGLFANSIRFNSKSAMEGEVISESKTYPGTNTTTTEVAEIMEKQRHHFENTALRNKDNVKGILEIEFKM